MRFSASRSIKTKILLLLLPIILASMATMSFISYQKAKTIVNKEIESKMANQIDLAINGIEKNLFEHSEIAKTLAKSAQVTTNTISQEQYGEILKGAISTNKNTFGSGIWFEPYKYNSKVKYFGPYAYKENGQTVFTDKYSNEKYNYFDTDWYKVGKNTSKDVEWSDPYFDEMSNITMVTTTVPFYDSQKNFMGVTTADIDLTTVQTAVANIKIGETGKAFLLDKQGTYIADTDKGKIMKMKITEDNNNSLKEAGKIIMSSKNGNTIFKDDNGKNRIYYGEMPETGWKIALTISEKELLAPVRSLLITLVAIIVVFSIAVIIFITIFANYLVKNIREVNNLAMAISENDLTKTIEVNLSDEIGQMVGHLNAMTRNLKEFIFNISNSVEHVAATSEQLTAGAQQTEAAADQIALSIQDIAANSEKQENIMKESARMVSEISQGIEHVSGNIQDITDLSMNTYKKAQDGNNVVDSAIDQMKNIDDKVNALSKIIDILGNKSGKIGNIIMVINDIAEQTNLLALNAAIEAARAGEHGKGFAVVAEEVRKLAEQSKDSTAEINKLVNDIRENIGSAVNAMEDGTVAVKDGITMVYNAEDSFKHILSSVDDISTRMQDASAVIEEITASSQNMVESIENIVKILEESSLSSQSVAASAEEQTALMKEVSNASQKLSEMAMEIDKEMNRFKL